MSYYDSLDLALTGIGGADIELAGGVYIFANTATTDSEGNFNLMNVPAGTYTFNVDAGIYGEYSESIEVKVGENTVVDVVLLAEEPGGISGSVVEVVDSVNEAFEGATVSVELVSTIYDFESSALTDGNGDFSLEQLPVGIYDLTISAEGYGEYSDVTPGGGIPVTAGGIADIGIIVLTLTTP